MPNKKNNRSQRYYINDYDHFRYSVFVFPLTINILGVITMLLDKRHHIDGHEDHQNSDSNNHNFIYLHIDIRNTLSYHYRRCKLCESKTYKAAKTYDMEKL